MSLLLDTNVCIALMNDTSERVRFEFEESLAAGNLIYISAVVQFELEYGISKSRELYDNRMRLQELFDKGIEVLDFTAQDALIAGEIRAQLERDATPIGPYDLLIAGQAVNRGLTLVTANTREFARVPNLQWQDWEQS